MEPQMNTNEHRYLVDLLAACVQDSKPTAGSCRAISRLLACSHAHPLSRSPHHPFDPLSLSC
jgi:hypothetical protein